MATPPMRAQACRWTNQYNGLTFDLGALATPAPRLLGNTSSSAGYYLGFCADFSRFCSGGYSSSFVVNAQGRCVRSYGAASDTQFKPLLESDPSAGVVVTYPSGDRCPYFPLTDAYTVVSLACVPGDPSLLPQGAATLFVDSVVEDFSSGACLLSVSARSPAACGFVVTTVVTPLGVGWIVFLAATALVALYLGAGVAYKRHRYGARGLESLPNIDFWRRVHAATLGRLPCAGGGAAYKLAGEGEDASYCEVDPA